MTKPDCIKTAIIGMGKMGRIRYDTALRHGGYEIVAVCDVNEGATKGLDCDVFTNAQTCLEQAKPEAVIICTVNQYLRDLVCCALDAGIHVFSEKPPGRNLAETLEMKKHQQASDRILKFGFNHRYHHSIIEAKTLVDFKLLGDVICARGVYGKAGGVDFANEWRSDPTISGGGILLDQGIHMLDLLGYFLGEFSEIKSSASQLYWNDIPAEDSVFAILKTADDKIASLHSSAIQWKHKFDLDLICTGGYISLNGLLTATQSYGTETITYYQQDMLKRSGKLGNPTEHTMVFEKDDSWMHEMSEFYDAVAEGKPLRNGTIHDAERVMRLIERIYRPE
jgi:predicted dehydrogenase